MLEKVTERIYYMMNEIKNDRPALGLVIGDNCCLVIDAGNSTKHAQLFLDEISYMNLPKVAYVVATHHHWDHIFGMKKYDAVKIASNNTYELAKQYWGLKVDSDSLEKDSINSVFTDIAKKVLKEEWENVDIIEEIKFDLLFNGELQIDLGGVTCLVKEINNPHRNDGTIVYVPEEKTLFLGDSAYGCIKDGKNCYDRQKLISMMREVKGYDADYYLCSHESICDKEEIHWYFNKLNMGLEVTSRTNKLEDVREKFKEIYKIEPSSDDLFFLDTIYE